MTHELRIESVSGSHEGRVRTNNEDSFCDRAADGLWAVADGMGGHENGEWASAAIVSTLDAVALPAEFEPACRAIADGIHTANGEVWREAERRGLQMGSTVVALLLRDGQFGVLWVGDSRAYLLRHGILHQLSRDHTQVQDMVDRGMLDPEAAKNHPMGHVLARAVGVRDLLEVDVITDEVEPGDIFLLCSDGLTGQVADKEIADILGAGTHRAALDRLIALTLERGAPDNVTVVVVAIQETTLLSLNDPIDTVSP